MNGIRLLIPRSAVHRIATGALLAGCALIGCVALAGCRVETGVRATLSTGEASENLTATDPACPPCPCETPAEAPEGGSS